MDVKRAMRVNALKGMIIGKNSALEDLSWKGQVFGNEISDMVSFVVMTMSSM